VALEAGTRFGSDEIAESIGAGGMGQVYPEGSESAAKLPFKPGRTAVRHRPETAVRFRCLPVSA
jgi:hypothetical protein